MTRTPHKTRVAATLAVILMLGGCASALVPTTDPAPRTVTPTASTSAPPAPAESVSVDRAAAAAQAFLASLPADQREQLLHAYNDPRRTTTWSNLPVAFSERIGIDLSGVSGEQYSDAMSLIEALLSAEGFATITGIMAGDTFLRQNSPGANRSLGTYYMALFGEPSESEPWAVQLGGHHLGFNADLDGATGRVTLAPTHLGSQPVVYPAADGADAAPLLPMYERAFDFFVALTDGQRARMYQGADVRQLECEPARSCSFPTGAGLAGSDLSEDQRTLLLDLIARWVGLADEATSADTLARISTTLDQTWVSWSGADVFDMTQGEGISVRVSGPDVYIELASQPDSIGADVDGLATAGWGHLHTIYRDPRNDYGGSVQQ